VNNKFSATSAHLVSVESVLQPFLSVEPSHQSQIVSERLARWCPCEGATQLIGRQFVVVVVVVDDITPSLSIRISCLHSVYPVADVLNIINSAISLSVTTITTSCPQKNWTTFIFAISLVSVDRFCSITVSVWLSFAFVSG